VTLGVLIIVKGSALAQAESRLAPPEGARELRSQLNDLRQLRFGKVPAGPIIDRYKQLIENFSEYPEVAEAMYDLARFYRSRDLERENMIYWFRQAISAAQVDKPTWNAARLDLARQLRLVSGDPNAVREARTLVEQVAAKRSDQILIMARVQSELAMQCIAEDNFAGAERHCHKLLNWDEESVEQLAPVPRKILQGIQTSTVQFLMQRLPNLPGTKVGKEAWLKDFSKKYNAPDLADVVKQVRDQVDKINPSITMQPSGMSTSRAIFLSLNIVVTVILTVVVLRKHPVWRKSLA
jgi:hypothetical protein